MSGVGLNSVSSGSFPFPLADFPYPAISALASNLGPRDFFRVRVVSRGWLSSVNVISSKYLRKLAQALDCNPVDQAVTKRKFSQLLGVSKSESKDFPITGSSSLYAIAKSSKEERDFLVFANAIMATQLQRENFFSDSKEAREYIEYLDKTRVLQSITLFDLTGKDISFVPSQICRLINLERLDLSNNQITFLPPELGRLQKLKILKVEKNLLETLPVEMGGLENLQGLFLKGNRLRSLPEEMGQLKALQWMLLGKNKLKDLPQGLWTLKKLYHLDLSANQFSSFPPAMGDLDNLSILDISGNAVVTLPKEVDRLKCLKRMKIDPFQWFFFPPEIESLENLTFEWKRRG